MTGRVLSCYSVLFRAIPCYSAQLLPLPGLQVPRCAEAATARLNQPKTAQQDKIVPKGTVGQVRIDSFFDLPERAAFTVPEGVQDAPLAVGKIVTDAVRWDVSARDETNDNIAGPLLELRLRLTSRPTQLNDLLGPTAPALESAHAGRTHRLTAGCVASIRDRGSIPRGSDRTGASPN